MYVVWCKDTEDYLREPKTERDRGILLFRTKAAAARRAAREYGFSTYTEAKKKDWCVVFKINVDWESMKE